MPSQRWFVIGAILGALGVALGAYGAHGLKERLVALGYEGDDVIHRIGNYETAVRYQMWHAIAIVLASLALAMRPSPWWNGAGWAFVLGIAIFCGLLYVLAFTGPSWRWLGAIVPIGGLSLIVGWLLMAVAALRS